MTGYTRRIKIHQFLTIFIQETIAPGFPGIELAAFSLSTNKNVILRKNEYLSKCREINVNYLPTMFHTSSSIPCISV